MCHISCNNRWQESPIQLNSRAQPRNAVTASTPRHNARAPGHKTPHVHRSLHSAKRWVVGDIFSSARIRQNVCFRWPGQAPVFILFFYFLFVLQLAKRKRDINNDWITSRAVSPHQKTSHAVSTTRGRSLASSRLFAPRPYPPKICFSNTSILPAASQSSGLRKSGKNSEVQGPEPTGKD